MSEVKNKILQKYVSNKFNDSYLKQQKNNDKYKNLAVFEELESNFYDNQNKQNTAFDNDRKYYQNKFQSDVIFKEIYEDENEDEIAAIRIAEKELKKEDKISEVEISNKIEEERNLKKKRERHDSDSEDNENDNQFEDHSSVSSTERELDELLKDEDGDIILEKLNNNKSGSKEIQIELKLKSNKQTSLESEGQKLKQQTVYRNQFGRKIEKHQTKEAKRKTLEKLNYNQLKEWAMGFIQKEEKKRQKEEINKRKDEPLTRYDIDAEAEEELRKKNRFGDPMKEILFNKNLKKNEINLEDNKMSVRGFYLPKCNFAGTINRFGIEPGYRWDGVDRSNGFEKRYIESQNANRAREQEYHKLRTEEM